MIWDVLAKTYPDDEDLFDQLDEQSHSIARSDAMAHRHQILGRDFIFIDMPLERHPKKNGDAAKKI